MKKLMVMAAVAMAAVVVNAANCNWGLDLYSAGSSDEYWDGKSYYVINGDAAEYITMLTDGKVEDFNKAMSEGIAAGTIVGGSFDEYSYGAAEGALIGVGSTISAIALTDGTVADSTFYYVPTIDTTGYTYEAGQQAPGTLSMSYDNDPNPWSSATVGAAPEPTSGLLLLIGVAGLALRRRRA